MMMMLIEALCYSHVCRQEKPTAAVLCCKPAVQHLNDPSKRLMAPIKLWKSCWWC